MYGVINSKQLYETAKYVCDILGHGSNGKAVHLLLETAAAETNLGKTKDTTKLGGMGLTQFDKLPFQDIKDRVSMADYMIIKDKMGINLEWVEWEHLRYNPLLAFLFTRLKYKKIPEEIPKTLEGRASYWKRWYNSELGKGTLGHYLEANKKHIG